MLRVSHLDHLASATHIGLFSLIRLSSHRANKVVGLFHNGFPSTMKRTSPIAHTILCMK